MDLLDETTLAPNLSFCPPACGLTAGGEACSAPTGCLHEFADSAANIEGSFAYQAITPYALTAGTDYIVGSYVYGSDLASSLDTGQGGSGSFNSDITVIQDQYSDDNSEFSFPSVTDDTKGAWLGGNFR